MTWGFPWAQSITGVTNIANTSQKVLTALRETLLESVGLIVKPKFLEFCRTLVSFAGQFGFKSLPLCSLFILLTESHQLFIEDP